MEDDLLEVYERAALGDVDGARALLSRLGNLPADQRAEMEAWLDGAGGDVTDVEALEAGLAGPATLSGPAERRHLRPDEVPFRCLCCGGEVHTVRRALLNTGLLSFLGWDDVDEAARVVTCAACGHCAWFGAAMPGALQAMADPGDARWTVSGGGGVPCRVCGFASSVEGAAKLNTRMLSFLGLDWLDRGARTDTCLRCGHVHWSRRGTEPWAQPARTAEVPGSCRACGGTEATERRVLLNDPLTTHLGLDWMDEGARLRACPCGALDWFVGSDADK